jgi:hypothetical protein
MKPFIPSQFRRPDDAWAAARAFTIPEISVAMTILMIALGGSLASHLFGIRMMGMSSAKADASAKARRNISTLISEIASARKVAVGSGDATGFSEAGMDTRQSGVSLQIWPSSDTNVFTRYFVETSTQNLKRLTNGAAPGVVIASGIKNSDAFTAEDFNSVVLSNIQNNCLIGLFLQFSQVESPSIPVGPQNHYTAYEVRTKIARRTP